MVQLTRPYIFANDFIAAKAAIDAAGAGHELPVAISHDISLTKSGLWAVGCDPTDTMPILQEPNRSALSQKLRLAESPRSLLMLAASKAILR